MIKKKDKKSLIDELLELENDILIDEVSEIFENNPENYQEELEKLGFKLIEENYEDEILEEEQAKPENDNQRILADYFSGNIALTEKITDTFLEEKYRENPNAGLLRRYFRQGNKNLKALILKGLEKDPSDAGFLNDLSFFNEFQTMLGELIDRYLTACEMQDDLDAFNELAQDFYYNTVPDGYDAYYALKEVYSSDSKKGKIIDNLIRFEKELEDPIII